MKIELSGFQEDALREIGNISASHAANSLSKMLGKKIEITSPSLNISTKQFSGIVEKEGSATCMCGHLKGGISGTALLLFPSKAFNLIGALDFQKTGNSMLSALANAMSGFFKLKVELASTTFSSDKLGSLLEFLAAELSTGAEKAAFFYSKFILSKQVVCYFFLSLGQSDVDSLMGAEVLEFAGEYRSFGEMVSTFEKLAGIEAKLNDFIQNTEVSMEAKKSFLRARGDLSREELCMVLKRMLTSSGVGKEVVITNPSPLKYEFAVEGCSICKIVPRQGVKSCYTTSTALGRFFLEALKIGSEVQETKCVKVGYPACVHAVTLEQIDVFSIIPEERDIEILRHLSSDSLSREEILRRTNLSTDALRESLSTLERYGILKVSNGAAAITELGQIFLTFAQGGVERAGAEITSKAAQEKSPWE